MIKGKEIGKALESEKRGESLEESMAKLGEFGNPKKKSIAKYFCLGDGSSPGWFKGEKLKKCLSGVRDAKANIQDKLDLGTKTSENAYKKAFRSHEHAARGMVTAKQCHVVAQCCYYSHELYRPR